MNSTIRNIQLVAVLIVLFATVIAFFLEIHEMYENKDINLADLLLMFIYIEVIGLVRSYWETRSVRITYPMIIAITALARFIILQDKDQDPTNLIYISLAILIVALATVIIRFRNSKFLKLDASKSNEL
ncbi:phosphate-starvation-inducible PsiE family protein [Pelagibacteraceae bacterium]|nr:phosphate-starvation-inducible PsiE family protein [Pelagibacteraceae bacterium]